MQKRTLPLSLLIGAALTIPSLAMAAPADSNDITPVATISTATADNTLETEFDSTDGELLSTQPSSFEISETKTFSRARVNSNIGQQLMTTEIKAPIGQQQPMTTEIKAPAEALQDQKLQTTEIISEDPVLDAPEDLAEISEEDDL